MNALKLSLHVVLALGVVALMLVALAASIAMGGAACAAHGVGHACSSSAEWLDALWGYDND